MKFLRLLCLVLLALSLVACGGPTVWLEGDEVGAEIAAIQKLGDDLDHAWDQRNADAFSRLFIDSGSFRFPSGTLLEGRQHIHDHYRDVAFPSFDADLIHQTRPKRIHLLSPTTAIADGKVDFIHTQAVRPEDRLDLVLFVTSALTKTSKGWRIAAVRLIPVPME